MIKKILKPIIAEAYEEGYRKGSDDVVRRMAYIYDFCRRKGREEGLTDVGAIDLDISDVPEDILNELAEDGVI